MNINELWSKYAFVNIEDLDGVKNTLMTKEAFTQALGEIISSPVEPEVKVQKAEIEIRKEFLQTLQDIYNSKGMVETQTKLELHFENIDSLLINKYQYDSDISLLPV